MTTYRLDFGYDGTGFRGYARNRGVRTVQAVLEGALGTVLGSVPKTSVAGRTDAGVHARHNVVSFPLSEPIDDLQLFHRSISSLVAPEVTVDRIRRVADDFDARFSATGRSYRYFVDDRRTADPLQRHRVWHVGASLDIEAMNTAAEAFVGVHDFSTLCRAAVNRSLVRNVLETRWRRDRGYLVYAVRASSFCHQMVRSMVALCVDAGRGTIDPGSISERLEARDRRVARGAAPARGLTLWKVEY
ncbi:MAG TPA: tRNA pseudouridine(38-40) synthase TruA [Acidimicrobiia bacterium]|nr:tRNA pseudouridine(38-40) synthase TruA [Acidimicrobiia bacterium]